jgi:hypothetical protein
MFLGHPLGRNLQISLQILRSQNSPYICCGILPTECPMAPRYPACQTLHVPHPAHAGITHVLRMLPILYGPNTTQAHIPCGPCLIKSPDPHMLSHETSHNTPNSKIHHIPEFRAFPKCSHTTINHNAPNALKTNKPTSPHARILRILDIPHP